MHATSTAFLAVTLKCARCHDHKFDPIPQADYYAVLNFFVGGKPAEGDCWPSPIAGPAIAAGATAGRRRSGSPGDTVPPGFLSMVSLGRRVDPAADGNRPAAGCNWPAGLPIRAIR